MTEQQLAGGTAGDSIGSDDRRRQARRGLVPSWLVVGGVLLVLGGGVAYLRQRAVIVAEMPASQQALPPALTVTAVAVERRMLPHRLALVGSVVAWDELPVGTEATGLRIVQVLADEGDRVEQGQLLAKLNDDILRAQIAQNDAQLQRARATIQVQQAAISEATATVDQSEANMRRARALFKTNVVSAEAVEQRQTDLASANSKLVGARAAIAAAEADEALAKARTAELTAKLAQTEIRAPTAGLISKRTAKLGQVLSDGGANLFRIVRDGIYELDAEVPELDLPQLHAGQEASVRLDSGQGKPIKAFIRLVAPLVDSQTRMGIAHIRLPTSGDYRSGQFLRATVDVGSVSALVVPEGALIYKDHRPAVFVIGANDNGAARVFAREIETRIRSDDMVEVTSGLSEGDRVAVAGAGFLKDGDTVAVAPSAGLGALNARR